MGLLSWTVGDVRITRIAESEHALSATGMFAEATKETLARYRDWLEPHFVDESGNLRISIHALVVESDGQRILVDTCVGDRKLPGYENLCPDTPRFLEDLAAAGFPRESIDRVLCTHMHFDHVGWNTMQQGERRVPTFPNARYLFARVEWEHWSSQEGRALVPSLDDAVGSVIDAGLADLVETDHRITPEVRIVPTPGHTPGHVSVCIESAGEQAFITGDMVHHPVQWAHPEWVMHADTDPRGAVATRERVRDERSGADTLVIGTHYAPPCAGRIERDGEGWRFVARR